MKSHEQDLAKPTNRTRITKTSITKLLVTTV